MSHASYTDSPLTIETLRSQHILNGESDANLTWLLKHSEQHTYNAGDVLLSPKNNNNKLYLIINGRVQVSLDGQEHGALTYLDAGNCVGEMSIIEDKRPSATVFTEQNCRLLLIDKDIVWALIERSNAVARNLLYILSSRVRNDNLTISETRQQQVISEQNSKVDALTNLYNRRWLDEQLPQMIQHAKRNNRDFCILMLDIDHFKRFNDNYGHHTGDAALVTVAKSLSKNIRSYDSAARFGGEEFIVLLPDTNITEAHIVAEHLRIKIREQPIENIQGMSLPMLTTSIGLCKLDHKQDPAQLLETVDAALYRAKNNGRNCVST